MLDTILTYNMNPASAYKYFGGNESDEDIGDIDADETYSSELNNNENNMDDLFSGAADKADFVVMPEIMEELFMGADESSDESDADGNINDTLSSSLFDTEKSAPIIGMAEMYYSDAAKIYEELAKEASENDSKEVPKKFIEKLQKHKKKFYKYLNK